MTNGRRLGRENPVRRFLCFGLLLMIVATSQVASAHYLSHSDPQDTPDGFDIKRVRLRMDDGDLIGKIVSYEDRTCCWEVVVDFDSRGNGRMDYYAYISFEAASGGLFADLRRRGGRLVDSIRARTDGADGALRFRFPASLLDKTKDVRWRVATGSWLADEKWQDLAPDAGWFDH